MEQTILYRPVGSEEMELIRQSGWKRLPPRLPGQPIFYPVLQLEYARKIARDWNANATGGGFVLRFRVRTEYLRRFEIHQVGGQLHSEYWIPAEQLDELNDNIEGLIECIEEYPGNDWIVAYALADDAETVNLVQRATLNSKQFGIVPEIALFGSDDWWRAINDGLIPKRDTTGTITRLYESGHNDWPQFELESNGTFSQWTRLGRQSLYAMGCEVRIEYVLQKLRNETLGKGDQKQVLRILIRERP